MKASTVNLYPTIAVTVEKLPDADIMIDDYIKKVEGVNAEDGKHTIAGKEYIKMTRNDKTLTMEIYCRVQDGYLVSIILEYTPDTASQKDTLLNAFSALK